ncbi:MAG: hypothetical protein LBT00_04380 [Spirochaetaceae bacterium]|jgi:hypothetical protein|nr:hypothetical protein [Spirochaetaceae bacterium]
MNKTAVVVILLLSIKVPQVYGQHKVNDITDALYRRMMGSTLMIDASKSDEEALASLEPEVVTNYKYLNW